jgi:hypothetical protein
MSNLDEDNDLKMQLKTNQYSNSLPRGKSTDLV